MTWLRSEEETYSSSGGVWVGGWEGSGINRWVKALRILQCATRAPLRLPNKTVKSAVEHSLLPDILITDYYHNRNTKEKRLKRRLSRSDGVTREENKVGDNGWQRGGASHGGRWDVGAVWRAEPCRAVRTTTRALPHLGLGLVQPSLYGEKLYSSSVGMESHLARDDLTRRPKLSHELMSTDRS